MPKSDGYKLPKFAGFYLPFTNIDAPQVSELPEDESYKLEYLKDLLRDAEITRPEHVDYYMDYLNIINLMN